MKTATLEKNILVKDSDGDWYTIQPDREQYFISLNEAIMSTEVGSSEWHDAKQEMFAEFGHCLK